MKLDELFPNYKYLTSSQQRDVRTLRQRLGAQKSALTYYKNRIPIKEQKIREIEEQLREMEKTAYMAMMTS